MKHVGRKVLLVLLGLTVAFIGFGCSGENSENPVGSPNNLAVGENEDSGVTRILLADQIQFDSRVASVDVAAKTLTFTTVSYVAIADEGCEIVLIVMGEATPVSFDAIAVGDSVRVCGNLQDDNTVLANKIRIFGTPDCPDYDVIFWDTITTIDYAAKTFTVANRTETIVVDDNTVIWSRIPSSNALDVVEGDGGGDEGNPWLKEQVEIYEFTDLAVGFVVEVHAGSVDTETLLAVSIKVAGCNFKKSVEFYGYLASVDVSERLVTFDGLVWVGTVCPQAALTDIDGTALTLADFSPGDYVAVKGYPVEGDAFYICAMAEIEP